MKRSDLLPPRVTVGDGGAISRRGKRGRSAVRALTRDFKELLKERLDRDPKAREAVQSMLDGDIETGKAVLRDYINATVGFEELDKATGTPPSEKHSANPSKRPDA